MQAVILAAGMGKRLGELTSGNTKCMVKVNGVTIIERVLSQLDELKLSRIVIVVGYKKDALIDYISTLNVKTPIIYIENPVYDTTNNIYSLFLASKELAEDDSILLESDIIFEKGILKSLLEDPRPSLAVVDKYESWMDGTVLKLAKDDSIIDFVSKSEFNFSDIPTYYKTVNIYKFSKDFILSHYLPFLKAYQSVFGENKYYEQVLKVSTMIGDSDLKALRLNGQTWYEIDDIQDLDIASSLFADSDEKLTLMQHRYGGYWRYPSLLDFCYLVNPYFPPNRLIDEMKANFECLLRNYPSGMFVNSLLAARNFSINQRNIVVGNGAAELIKAVTEKLEGKIGVIRPTFEEYPNRLPADRVVCYKPLNEGLRYDANDVINFFSKEEIKSLILINPDNPSGNYIPQAKLLSLINWCNEKGIRLIIDESFVDFAIEEDSSLIKQDIVNNNPSLIIVKSISKSYGVPGLRLGVLVSGDTSLIEFLKKEVSIWNINSFAEFFMQIESKYHRDYELSLKQIKETRAKFINELKKIKNLEVFDSQANYILIKLQNDLSSTELTKYLLSKEQILIKDLSSKLNGEPYIRIAVRNEEENERLLVALRKMMG